MTNFKVGQRVQFRGEEGYLIHYCVDDDYWHIDVNGKVENCYDITELSPLYKPGDKVKVLDIDRLLPAVAEDCADCMGDQWPRDIAGKTTVIDKEGHPKNIGIWSIDLAWVEWHTPQEPELQQLPQDVKKLAESLKEPAGDALIGVKRADYSHCLQSKPNGMGSKIPDIFDFIPSHLHDDIRKGNCNEDLAPYFQNFIDAQAVIQDIDTAIPEPPPGMNKKVIVNASVSAWCAASMHIQAILQCHKPILPPEVHQTSANRVEYQPPVKLAYRCPECAYSGTRGEVKAHARDDHDISLPAVDSGWWNSRIIR